MRELIIKEAVTKRSPELKRYFDDIDKIPLLGADEEAALAKRIREGDKIALEEMIKSNLRFVVSVAKQYQGTSGIELTDLISGGNIGLIKAAKAFDETRGFKFISYAVWWIRSEILDVIGEQARTIRLPDRAYSSIKDISETRIALEQELGRETSDEEINKHIEIAGKNSKLIKMHMTGSQKVLSLDNPITADSENSLLDLIEGDSPSPSSSVESYSVAKCIDKYIDKLPSEIQKKIIQYTYGLNGNREMTDIEIEEKLQVPIKNISEIRKKALRRLKNMLHEDNQLRDSLNND